MNQNNRLFLTCRSLALLSTLGTFRAVLFMTLLLGSFVVPLAVASESPAKQIQNHIKEGSIQEAQPKDLLEAIKLAVVANPKAASAILQEAFALRRTEMDAIGGDIVGAVIAGLGPEPSVTAVSVLVRLSVQLQPRLVLKIVHASVKAAPAPMAPSIVKAAVAAFKNPPPKLIAEIVQVASKARSGKLSKDGKRIIPLEVSPVEDLQAAALAGLDPTSDFSRLMDEAGPKSVPAIPPHEVHPPTFPSEPDPASL